LRLPGNGIVTLLSPGYAPYSERPETESPVSNDLWPLSPLANAPARSYFKERIFEREDDICGPDLALHGVTTLFRFPFHVAIMYDGGMIAFETTNA